MSASSNIFGIIYLYILACKLLFLKYRTHFYYVIKQTRTKNIFFFLYFFFLHQFSDYSDSVFNFNGSQNQTISLINCKKDSDNDEDGNNGAYH